MIHWNKHCCSTAAGKYYGTSLRGLPKNGAKFFCEGHFISKKEKVAKWSINVVRGRVAKLAASSVDVTVQLRLALLVHIFMVICLYCCLSRTLTWLPLLCGWWRWLQEVKCIYLIGWLDANIRGFGWPLCFSVDSSAEWCSVEPEYFRLWKGGHLIPQNPSLLPLISEKGLHNPIGWFTNICTMQIRKERGNEDERTGRNNESPVGGKSRQGLLCVQPVIMVFFTKSKTWN